MTLRNGMKSMVPVPEDSEHRRFADEVGRMHTLMLQHKLCVTCFPDRFYTRILVRCWHRRPNYMLVPAEALRHRRQHIRAVRTDLLGTYTTAHPRLAKSHLWQFDTQKSGCVAPRSMSSCHRKVTTPSQSTKKSSIHLLADAMSCIDEAPNAFLLAHLDHLFPRLVHARVG